MFLSLESVIPHSKIYPKEIIQKVMYIKISAQQIIIAKLLEGINDS